jgi:ADP-dependent NAD(P)H-hydrate dehydratase
MANALPTLTPRRDDAHKGDFGRALLIGGSRGMAGAIALAGLATLRSGAGLVRLAVPDRTLETVAAFEPCFMTTSLPNDSSGRINLAARDALGPLLDAATCVALGPGIGRSDELNQLVEWLYVACPKPLVIDADALNALSAREQPLAGAAGTRILTPHPGEFSRLAKPEQKQSWEEQAARAEAMARKFVGDGRSLTIVLKGSGSLVTDGVRSVRNQTGNPGMATGGSGDVLTGIITALVCQGLSPFEAAWLGCHVHGLSGDLAAAKYGETAMIARDLIEFLPAAFQALKGG